MKLNGMGKAVSLYVKMYAILFGSISFIVLSVLFKRFPTLDEALGILSIMLGFEAVIASIDISMVTKNIKNIKDNV